MEQVYSKFKTVKEWEHLLSPYIKLHNYDGFVEIYEKLSGVNEKGFNASQELRFSSAGNLLCTRRGFVSGLLKCTLTFPKLTDYEEISNILPNYIESEINMKLALKEGELKHGTKELTSKMINEFLELIRIKIIAREKNIKQDGSTQEKLLSKIDMSRFSKQSQKMIRVFNLTRFFKGTAEELEMHTLNKIMKYLKENSNKESLEVNNNFLNNISLLREIYYATTRYRGDIPIEGEFMYVDILDKKEPFQQEYTIYDGKSKRKTTGYVYRNNQDGPIESTAINVPLTDNNEETKPKTR